MIANRMRITTEAFLGEIFTFTASTTRVLKTMIRNLRRSRWFLLLAIAGGAVLGVVAIKLIALLGAAFDISFLRDVGNNVPPGAAAGGGASGGGWWGNDPPPLGLLFISALTGPGTRLHQDPSMDSRSVGLLTHGSRVIYDDIQNVKGQDWYRIIAPGNPGPTPGWIPGSSLSSTRPPPMPPGRPLKIEDTGILDTHPTASMVGASSA